jgi:hypothetical protein
VYFAVVIPITVIVGVIAKPPIKIVRVVLEKLRAIKIGPKNEEK